MRKSRSLWALAAVAATAGISLAVPPHGKAPVPPPGSATRPAPAPVPPPGGDEPIPGGPGAQPPTPAIPPPAPKVPLRVGVTTWIAHAPGFVAAGGLKTQIGSIYAKKGLDVEFVLVDDPAEARAKFGKGELDLVTTTLDAFAAEGPSWGGASAKLVLVESWSRGADGVVVAAEVAGVEDLAEQEVGVIDSTASRFLIGYLAEAAGSERGPPRIVRLPDGASVKDAFRKKTAAAAVLWEPYLAEALTERPGARKLLTTAQASGMIADVLLVRDDVIAKDGERLQKLVDGWYQGLAELRANAKSASKVAGALSLDAPDVTAMLANVSLAGRDETLALFAPGAPLVKGGPERPSHFDRLAAAAARVLNRGSNVEKATVLVEGSFIQKSPAIKVKKTKPVVASAKPAHLLRFGNALRFAPGTDVVDASADLIIDQVGELLLFMPAARVRIEPAAAGRGALSLTGKQRAAAIAKRLGERFGIPATRVLPPQARPAPAGVSGAEDTVWISALL